ncbi:MAG: AAA family ATPase, partial [Acidimicrobiales bacterium]
EAVLALHPDHPAAHHLLRSAQTALARTGERRQLTVMFSDVVGSTNLSSQADPEIVREILRAYQGTCAEVVAEYGGHIASYIGDGMLAYFGYPTTHEDDPERAVRAGLHLLDALEEVATSARTRYRLPFAARVAVHTGLVVRAEMGTRGLRDVDAIVGATPNIAARLQEHAQPGTLLISAATYALVRQTFAVRGAGALTLRGVPAPLEAFEVLGEHAATPVPPTPFCDRRAEFAQLQAAWADVAGGCQTVVILGEAGIGKSRLAEEFRLHVELSGGTSLQSSCSEFHRRTALYPARRLLEGAWGIDPRDPSDRTLPKLRTALADLGRDDLVGVFAELLGLAPSDGWEPPELDGPHLREVTFEAFVDLMASQAAAAATLIVIDDLHWSDPSTIELIGRLLARNIPGLMVALTAREQFSPPWPGVITVRLERFVGAELRTLASAVPEGEGLREEAVEIAMTRSGGVPLYVEELIRAVDAEPVALAPDADTQIPPVLVGPLLARLAAPGVDLALCQAIATVGREADHEVLAALMGLPDADLDAKLHLLSDARLVEVCGGDHRAYRFRHELMRDLAYETQLHPERRRLHSAIADILDAIEVNGLPGDSGAIAYHLERAGRIAGAVDAYVTAARRSLALGALTEAIDQLDLCLKLLDEVPDVRRRDQLELAVRQVRGMAWVSARGYSWAPAVEDFRRCVELCEQIGPDADPVPGIEAIWYYYLLHGELDRAESLMRRARAGRAVEVMIPEEGVTAPLRFFRGDFTGAIADMEAFVGSTWAKETSEVPSHWPMPDDPLANVLSFLGLARWIAGDPAASQAAFQDAHDRAASLDFPHGPFANAYTTQLELITARIALRDAESDRLIDEMAAIADRHGFGFFRLSAQGQRMISRARREGSLAELDSIAPLVQMMGLDVWKPFFSVQEAMVALGQGDAVTAVARADRAFAAADETGARFLWAEAARVRGEARLVTGDLGGIDDLDQAIAAAREQGSRLFELRALIARRRAPGGGTVAQALGDLVASLDGLPELGEARALL